MIMRRIRSFARRDGRITPGQKHAWKNLGPELLLDPAAGVLDYAQTFGREAACYLEIGFGSGLSLAAIAEQTPEYNFIGVEMFKPGIGMLMSQIESRGLRNVRVYYGDAVDILERCIPDRSLQGVQIFFPDPWPKRRHFKRRLIQPEFTRLATSKLIHGGLLHLATDWEDYAKQMMQVLSAEPELNNIAGFSQFAERSTFRPLVTKFEGKGEEQGRSIWELQFARR